MKYFDSLPTIAITDETGKSQLYRNIMTRISMKSSIFKNPLSYYQYDIQEGDTPEIVAHKYYGDSYRYWVVLLSNQMLDPQWDWPMSPTQLREYIDTKYADLGIDPYTAIKVRRKVITQQNLSTRNVVTQKVQISKAEYDNLSPSQNTFTFADGQVVVTTTKEMVNYNDYELERNENRRSIRLLNKDYVPQIEREFLELVK